ncbi:MAG TPA: DUF3618 domain-containing protein [Xanthobacteraceae bacterium]|jgi:hypothetical protein
MASTDGKSNSLDELERDAERTRADLAHTVDELRSRITDTASDIRERVSPAAIKQDVRDYVHQTGQQLYHNIETRARENPLQAVAIAAGLAYPIWRIVTSMPAPILLIGAGIALSGRSGHAASHGGSSYLDQGREKLGAATAEASERARYASAAVQDATMRTRETVQDAALRAKDAIQETTQRTRDAVADTAQRTREQVSGALDRVGSTVSSTLGTVTNSVTDAVSGARDSASKAASQAASAVSDAMSSSYQTTADAAAYARDQAVWAGNQTRQTFLQQMERNPLLVGGLGLAIGALIASAIPATAPEKRMFGESSEELQRRAREMAARGYETARSAAGEIYDETARAAKEQGLSVDALRQAADDLSSKVRNVAERATGMSDSNKQAGSAGYSAEPKTI